MVKTGGLPDSNQMLNHVMMVSGDLSNQHSLKEGIETPYQDTQNIQKEQILDLVLVSLLAILVFITAFVFRSFDDNSLTSWQWSVTEINLITLLLALIAGLVIALRVALTPLRHNPSVYLLFAGSFLTGSLFWSEPEVVIDVSRYFTQAKHLELYGLGYFFTEWGSGIGAWTDLPLIPLVYGSIFSLFGESRLGPQVFTTLCFSGSCILTYLVGKKLWDKTTGLLAGALLLAMPYLLTQIPLMLVDVATMFFLTLAVYAAIEAASRGGIKWLVAASCAIVLAMLSKYSTWLLLSVIPVIFIVFMPGNFRQVFLRGLAVLSGVLILLTLTLPWLGDTLYSQIMFLYQYQLPGLKRWEESYLSTFLFQVHPFVTISALLSIVFAWRARDVRYLIVVWMLLLLFILEVKRIRYILVAMPMLALMAGYGLMQLKNPTVRRFVAASSVTASITIALLAYLPFLKGTSAANIAQAGAYLDHAGTDAIEVLALHQPNTAVNPIVAVPTLDLYTQRNIYYSQHSKVEQAPLGFEKSPLRFTWEFNNPDYYQDSQNTSSAGNTIVVIASKSGQALPENLRQRLDQYHLAKEFNVTGRVFRYQTILSVYQANRTI